MNETKRMYCVFYTILLSFSLFQTLWAYKTVCYWDASSKYRQKRFGVTNLKKSLWQCNDLIVGFLEVHDRTFNIPNPTPHQIKTLQKVIWSRTDGMRVSLGIGSSVYYNWNVDTYNRLLEHEMFRNRLVAFATRLAVQLDMDGIDLAWPFLPNPGIEKLKKSMPQKVKETCRKLLAMPRRTAHEELKVSECLDEEGPRDSIRDAFTELILSLSASLKKVKKELSLTVLPRTSVDYYAVAKIAPVLKNIHLLTFDYVTPAMQPELADYTAPLYDSDSGKSGSADATIRSWKNAGTPGDKIVMGIPAFGRSWRVKGPVGPDKTQPPPYPAENALKGPKGANGYTTGLEYYDAVCWPKGSLVQHNPVDEIFSITANFHVDTETYRGSYQYWTTKMSVPTMWATYEDKQIIIAKVKYVKNQGLGGVGVYDLSFDDTSEHCKDGSVLSIARKSLVSPA